MFESNFYDRLSDDERQILSTYNERGELYEVQQCKDSIYKSSIQVEEAFEDYSGQPKRVLPTYIFNEEPVEQFQARKNISPPKRLNPQITRVRQTGIRKQSRQKSNLKRPTRQKLSQKRPVSAKENRSRSISQFGKNQKQYTKIPCLGKQLGQLLELLRSHTHDCEELKRDIQKVCKSQLLYEYLRPYI